MYQCLFFPWQVGWDFTFLLVAAQPARRGDFPLPGMQRRWTLSSGHQRMYECLIFPWRDVVVPCTSSACFGSVSLSSFVSKQVLFKPLQLFAWICAPATRSCLLVAGVCLPPFLRPSSCSCHSHLSRFPLVLRFPLHQQLNVGKRKNALATSQACANVSDLPRLVTGSCLGPEHHCDVTYPYVYSIATFLLHHRITRNCHPPSNPDTMPVAVRRAAVAEHTSSPPLPSSSIFTPQSLLQQSRWIRDDLDPQVARNGPNALRSDDLLVLDQFLRRLQASKLTLDDIRYSRLHLAMLSISGLATRWPNKLIERADELRTDWEALYGPLKTWGTPLYEKGGRLNGLCKAEDVHNEMLIAKWLKSKSAKINPLSSRKSGSIGFTAGE